MLDNANRNILIFLKTIKQFDQFVRIGEYQPASAAVTEDALHFRVPGVAGDQDGLSGGGSGRNDPVNFGYERACCIDDRVASCATICGL